MTQLVLHGGAGEIGGSKIFLKDEETSIFLDFGKSFSGDGVFYDTFLQPRSFALIDEYIRFGLLPEIAGLYREDYLKHTNAKNPLCGNEGQASVDGVLISHAHLDHIGLIPYLRPDIQLIGSDITFTILDYLDNTTSGDRSQFCAYYPSFELVPMKRGEGMKRATKADLKNEKIEREFIKLDKSKSYTIGNIEVHGYPVDHSLAGAYGYILKTSMGNIAYTGDLRFHGYDGSTTENFVNVLKDEEIKILLCEGTRIQETPGITESSLETSIRKVIDDTKHLVLCYYPFRDTNRILSFSKAAAACGRRFLINPKQAYFIHQLTQHTGLTLPDMKNLEILLPRKGWGIWSDTTYDEKTRKGDYTRSYPKVINEFLENKDVVTPQEVASSQNEYVVTCSFYELNLLHDLLPKEGSKFIWSRSDPFDEEGEIEYNRVQAWLDYFNLGEPLHMHCSGHLSGTEIASLIEKVNPEILVPIHTEHPEKFKEFHNDVRILEKGEVLHL